MAAFKGLPKSPVGRCSIEGGERGAIAGDNPEGESLALKTATGSGSPHGAPIPPHGIPPSAGSLHVHLLHISRPAHVVDEDQEEVRVSIDSPPHATLLHTGNPVV